MKLAKLALLAATLTVTPFAANAQEAGVTVYGNDDQPAGTIESNDGTNAVLDTGSYKVPLGLATFAERDGKWTINATKGQIDGMMAQQAAAAAAKLDAALSVGNAVSSADGQDAGSVLAIDSSADQILVKRGTGLVSLKKEHFAVDAEGKLTALYTLDQLGTFTTEVPEGAEVRTASGELVDFAGTGTTASTGAAVTTGASE